MLISDCAVIMKFIAKAHSFICLIVMVILTIAVLAAPTGCANHTSNQQKNKTLQVEGGDSQEEISSGRKPTKEEINAAKRNQRKTFLIGRIPIEETPISELLNYLDEADFYKDSDTVSAVMIELGNRKSLDSVPVLVKYINYSPGGFLPSSIPNPDPNGGLRILPALRALENIGEPAIRSIAEVFLEEDSEYHEDKYTRKRLALRTIVRILSTSECEVIIRRVGESASKDSAKALKKYFGGPFGSKFCEE